MSILERQDHTKSLVRGAIIAAIYAALTLALAPISYGAGQLRVAEALTVLPFVMPRSAVPGLFVGCLLANLFGGGGIWDIVFGSAATLLAALLTARCRHRLLAPLPPVVLNAVVVGTVLYVLYYAGSGIPIWLIMAQVGAGQCLACYGLGLALLRFVETRFPSWRERN